MPSFPRGAAIGGVPVTTIKAILKSIESTRSFTSAIQLCSIGTSRCDNAIAADIAVQAGLVDALECTLTDLGQTVLGSTPKAQLPHLTIEDRDRLLAFRPSPRPLPANWACNQKGIWSPSRQDFNLSPATSGHYLVAKFIQAVTRSGNLELCAFTHADKHELEKRGLPPLPGTFDGHAVALIVVGCECLALQRRIEPNGQGTVVYSISLSGHALPDTPLKAFSASERTAFEDIIGYYLASLVYGDTLYIRTTSDSAEIIHFFTEMPKNKAIEVRMRYWAEHLIKGTPSIPDSPPSLD